MNGRTTSDHPGMLHAAEEAVVLACAVCRHVQRGLEHVRAITKDDRSPVTVADFASQAVVARTLRARLGNVTLVGEESSQFLRDPTHAPHLAAAVEAARVVWPGVDEASLLEAIDHGAAREVPESRTFWTVDPVDGTKGFLRGQQYAVALAFIENGTPVLGVLGCPNLPSGDRPNFDRPDRAGVLLSAVRGGGATARPCDGAALDSEATPVPVRPGAWQTGTPIRMCESAESAHSDHGKVSSILAALGPAGPSARLDSQCKYAVVARGQADAYLRMPSSKTYVEKIWDHGAGAVVAQEAGCVVSDARGEALDFSRGTGLSANRGILVSPPGLHARIVEAIVALGLSPVA